MIIKHYLVSFTLCALLLLPVIPTAQAADHETLQEQASGLAEQTAEAASGLGDSLKAWGSQAWEAGKEAVGVAAEKLEATDTGEVGETIKDIGNSLLEGGKRAADAAKEKMDEFSREREAEEAPEVEAIAI